MEAGYYIERMDAKGGWVATDGRPIASRAKAIDKAEGMALLKHSAFRVVKENGAVLFDSSQDDP
jgi:hypothetical protein